MLSKLGVDFEGVDIRNDPGGLERLQKLGVKTVPVVAVGDRYVHGLRPKEVADLVGASYSERTKLPPAALIEKLDLVLAASARYIRQVPDNKLDLKSPDRDRPLRGVVFHTFSLVEAFLDTVRLNHELTVEALSVAPPAELATGPAIGEYGERVREQVRTWFAESGDRDWSRPFPTYYGPEPLHDLLERTTWHSAQHVRHLMLFLSWIDIQPDGPIGEADLAGLPLPDAVWD